MKNYQYYLFDWDGCVAKTLDLWLETYRDAFAEYNLFPTDQAIIETAFGDWNGPLKMGIVNIGEFNQKLKISVDQKYPNVELYDHALVVIQTLKDRGKKLALVTTSSYATFGVAIEKHKLKNIFDVILSAEDVERHKPDPEIVDKAIALLGGKKAETVIIGDSKKDLGAATNAGIDSVLFFPSQHKLFYDFEDLKKYQPTEIIGDFKELLN